MIQSLDIELYETLSVNLPFQFKIQEINKNSSQINTN